MKPQIFNNLRGLLTVFCTGLLISCSGQNHQNSAPNQRQLAVEEASYWIDNNDPGRAIQILSPWLDSTEVSFEQNQIKLVLSSAYVSRSGIEMTGFVAFLKKLKNLSSDQNKVFELMEEQLSFLVSVNPEWRDAEDSKKYIFKFYKFLFVASQLVELANSLPMPRPGGGADLEMAIRLISPDNELMTSGNFLFRGALQLFLINYNIKNNHYFKSFERCPLSLSSLESDLNNIRSALLGVLSDMTKALPRQKDSIDEIIQSVSQANLKESIQKMDPVTFEYFLKTVDWIEEEQCP